MAITQVTSLDQVRRDLRIKEGTAFLSKDSKRTAYIIGINISKNEVILRTEPGSKIVSVSPDKLAPKASW